MYYLDAGTGQLDAPSAVSSQIAVVYDRCWMHQQWDHEVETFPIVDGGLPEEARHFLEGRGLLGWEAAAITTVGDRLLMILKRPRGWVPPSDDAPSGSNE